MKIHPTGLISLLSCITCGLVLSGCGTSTPLDQTPNATLLEENVLTSQTIGVQNWSASAAGGRTTIYNNGVAVQLRGINWFGLDSSNQLGGVWTQDGSRLHDLDFWFSRIKALGFNAVRIPLNTDTIYNDATGTDNALSKVVQKANAYGMYVLLDFQTCSTQFLGGSLVGDPSKCPNHTWDINYWLDYMDKLARFAKANLNVVGIDLFNEPHAIDWTQWKSFAEQGVNKIEQTYGTSSQNVLYFVEGSGNTPDWGGDIRAVNNSANRLFSGNKLAGQIVYSPHFYGRFVTARAAADIVNSAIDSGANVVVGEFGMTPSNTQWGSDFIAYSKAKSSSFFYWALNANEGDGPYGILKYESNNNSNWCQLESNVYNTLKWGYGLPSNASINTVCY